MYNSNNGNVTAVPTFDPAYGPDCVQNPHIAGMKETLAILHDNNEKMRAMICEIRNNLFGFDPPEWTVPECNCAQDEMNVCKAISTQSIELLHDILLGINGD